MAGRGGLTIAVLILAAMALLATGMATALLTFPQANFGATLLAIEHMQPPGSDVLAVLRSAAIGGAMVTGWCALVGIPIGMALAAMPRGWAVVGYALLVFPALTITLAWLMSALFLGQHTTAAAASLGATDVVVAAAAVAPKVGLRALLAVLLVPWLANHVEAGNRGLRRSHMLAVASLGISWPRRFISIVLPRVIWSGVTGAIAVFVVATLLLAARTLALATRRDAVRAAIATMPVDPRAVLALECAVAGLLLLLWLLIVGLRSNGRRHGLEHEAGGGEILESAAH